MTVGGGNRRGTNEYCLGKRGQKDWARDRVSHPPGSLLQRFPHLLCSTRGHRSSSILLALRKVGEIIFGSQVGELTHAGGNDLTEVTGSISGRKKIRAPKCQAFNHVCVTLLLALPADRVLG